MAEGLTIDELAQRVGMTVRNVRAYQSKGLIPPPELQGRTGYYDEGHVARLELIKDLQAEGFNLEAIRRILERAPSDSIAETLDFTRAVAAPFSDERPLVVDAEELLERWGEQLTPELGRKLERLGLIRELGDGRFELRSPRLEAASRELADLGVPLATAVATIANIKRHAEAIARAYVDLFLAHVWRPFAASGEPRDEWPQVRGALDSLRPQATEALVAVFQIVMTDTVERTLERELKRLGSESREQASRRRSRGRGRRRR
jgi:DNA-binding transcriptional MerR regulator